MSGGRSPGVLLLPGYQDPGPEHRQSLREATHPDVRRVVQRDWESPDREEWVERLRRGAGPAGEA